MGRRLSRWALSEEQGLKAGSGKETQPGDVKKNDVGAEFSNPRKEGRLQQLKRNWRNYGRIHNNTMWQEGGSVNQEEEMGVK
jgi:hypothetical protein